MLGLLILSLVTEANTGSEIFQFPLASIQQEVRQQKLLTMEEALKNLKKASDLAKSAGDENSQMETKQFVLKALADIGAYQFNSGYISREWMDNVIGSLLNVHILDDDVAKAIATKIGDLNKNILTATSKDGFARFLSSQLGSKIYSGPPEIWPHYLSIIESTWAHASQIGMLVDFYIQSNDDTIKQRAFERLYLVLMDPNLYYDGQSSPAMQIARVLKTFLKEELEKKSLNRELLSKAQYQKIYDLFTRFDEIRYIDGFTYADVIVTAMRFAELENVSEEMKLKFESIAIRHGSKSHLMKHVFKDIKNSIETGTDLTQTQVRVLKKIEISKQDDLLLRVQYLKQIRRAKVLGFPFIKRAIPSCRSFYDL